ncbi:MAG TPA: DNA mismatch repair protein MutS [Rhodoblastus sp.]|nr:DNA mismatch repair protein MutS [Rhodoblastus sp.]
MANETNAVVIEWPSNPKGPSVLFASKAERMRARSAAQPDCFADLALDRIVAAATSGLDEYDLARFFFAPLADVEAVVFRQAAFRDLEDRALFAGISDFAGRMRTMRKHSALAAKLRVVRQKQAWLLEAADVFRMAVRRLADDLAAAEPRSAAFAQLRDWLAEFVASPEFLSLTDDIKRLRLDLAGVRYCIRIKGGSFEVRKPADEFDYGADVEDTFARFRQGEVEDHLVRFHWFAEMDHIEEQALEFVARLYPGTFADLEAFSIRHAAFLDDTIAAFDREVQFYLAWIAHMDRFRAAGLAFCYPDVSDRRKDIAVEDGFDLALADRLQRDGKTIVCNDFALNGPERIIVVSGPNQGGKTTFARMFGQLHHLAALGLPTPGVRARLFLGDTVFTHFEREERVETARGKLEDDLLRIRAILDRATSRSLVVMNEIFTSTTLHDALFLSERVMQALVERDLLCVWVTFIDELASWGPQTVSMESSVDPADLTRRTFKIVRKAPDGLAYAMAIAEKYRVTYRALAERISP